MTLDKKQIIILGAGYGGLCTALKLERLLKRDANWRILLIDRCDIHQLKTELHELAAGKTNYEAVSIPITRLTKNKKMSALFFAS
jgi:NADH dehydrogenase